jgi:L-alanine-DL-glutamate epimerase-like enolase superfamily enzyme|tara:strand:+ start:691 stop:909 length:219 start_codon:yes stop_codon:yes gene_type:complete
MQMSYCFTNDEGIINIRDMHQTLKDDIGIILDVNQGWRLEEAIKVVRAIKKYVPEWLEEPIMVDDFDRYDKK